MNLYEINETAARRAKEANSFGAYKEGSATAEYNAAIAKATEIAECQKAHVDTMYHNKIDDLLAAYKRRLAANINHRNEIDARVPSIMIAGPANFPTRAKEKQNAARDKNSQEWHEISMLLNKIMSVGTGGISADDPNALIRLREKLAGLEKMQETMKAVNLYYRQHKALDGCQYLTDTDIERLKVTMSRDWRSKALPFAGYQLQNNNAEIHRIRCRIAEMEKRQAEPSPEGWEFDGGEVVINTGINRLQIIYPGKPDAETIKKLKSYAFRWAPSLKAWQRQLTDNAIRAAKAVTHEMVEVVVQKEINR